MRVLVFFDLPVETKAERREYARFRRALVKDGFLMMQESVYCKLALNPTAARSIMDGVRSRRCFWSQKSSFPAWGLFWENIIRKLLMMKNGW